VTRGFAGLWWRADGEAGVLAFDNMQAREIKGDTDWKEYEVVLEIPEKTININFGVILPGDGKAWFVDLKVDIGGQASVLGSLSPALLQTYNLAVARGQISAQDLPDTLSPSTKSNRLKELERRGLLYRVGEEVIDGGGRRFIYEPVR